MECKKTRKFCKLLEQRGAIVYPVVASRYAPSGYPDRIIWDLKWQGWIEFKDHSTVVKELQWKRLAELNARKLNSAFLIRFHATSHTAGVVYSWEKEKVFEFSNPTNLLNWLRDLYTQEDCAPAEFP